MEEKVLVQNQRYNAKKLFILLMIIGLVISMLCSVICIADLYIHYNIHQHTSNCYGDSYQNDYEDDLRNGGIEESKMDCYRVAYDNASLYVIQYFFRYNFVFCIIPITVLAVIGGAVYLLIEPRNRHAK